MSEKLLILGIAISLHKTDGVLRFENYCQKYGLEYRIVGEGKKWYGGDMSAGTGGGQKIKELSLALESIDNQLVVICDTFDLLPIAGPDEILKKFHALCKPKHILFSSEIFCWPDKYLSKSYPLVNTKYKYLNSGSFIGYSDDIYGLIKNDNIKNNDDDQLYFTNKYLAGQNIILDHKCELFQAINGSKDDLVLHKNRVYNRYTNSYPIFIHGNGPSKLFLNHLENYLEPDYAKNYFYTITPNYLLVDQPKVFFALYVDSSLMDHFLHFIDNILGIDYQNRQINIYDKSDNSEIKELMEKKGFIYHPNIVLYQFDDFKSSDCQYYFLVEQGYMITKKDILHELLPHCQGYHRIIAPLLAHKERKSFSNFWGALDNNGYYKRSDDYFDLIEYKKRGLWNVPYVAHVLLIDRNIIVNFNLLSIKKYGDDNDMNLCHNCRKETIFMYMANFNHYGYFDVIH